MYVADYMIKNDNKIIAKPILKWAGGKSSLIPQITSLLPSRLLKGGVKRYIEPFIGGGAVFFEIANNYDIKEAFLFDINIELVILYNVVKNNVHLLIEELKNLKSDYEKIDDKKSFFYEIRKEYNSYNKDINVISCEFSFIRRSALTIFLNKTCFNGLFRVNSKNEFNVPMGRYKNPKILDEKNLLAVSEKLKIATIMKADFSKSLDFMNKDTFVYYDPPYRPINKTSYFNDYANVSFDDKEQLRLKKVADLGSEIGALQMLSNSDPTNYDSNDLFFDELYKNYDIKRIMAKRMINSDPEKRNEIREILIRNYA